MQEVLGWDPVGNVSKGAVLASNGAGETYFPETLAQSRRRQFRGQQKTAKIPFAKLTLFSFH
jgi:hypothetical protein